MNRKILMSLGVVVFVTALSLTATGAFFSDTETSSGNTFTAGEIDLKIDSEQHYNGMVCKNVNGFNSPYVWIPEAANPATFTPADATTYNTANPGAYPQAGVMCDGSWALTDLGEIHKFFNFDDIKPGDEGENTISIHIDSNPAWMCVDIAVVKNDDMTCTEPELGDDATCVPTPGDVNPMDGELAQNINFFSWLDSGATVGFGPVNDLPDVGEGDNIWQVNEIPLFSNNVGPLSDAIPGKTYALADSGTGFGPLPPGATQYIGLAWCAGTMTAVGGVMTCDGSTMDNETQTDSAVADITFRIEQSRNNDTFLCTPRETVPETATVTVDKEVTFSSSTVVGVDVNDFTLTIDGPVPGTGDAQVVVDEIATAGLPLGLYTVSEVYSNDPLGAPFNASFSGSCTEIGDTGEATMTLVAGVNPTCVITNTVSPIPQV